MNNSLNEKLKEAEARHSMQKELVSMLADMDMKNGNPFRLVKIEMEINDKIHNVLDPNKINDMDSKDMLKIEKSLLKILDVVNKEVE